MVPRVTCLSRGALFTALFLSGVSSAQTERAKLVVLEIAVNDSNPDETERKRVERLASAIDAQLLTELSKSERFKVIGASDVASMIGMERQKQLLGCTDEESSSCMAELSGALGAPFMLAGALSRAGTKLRLDLKLLRADRGEVVAREGAIIAGEDEVFGTVSQMVRAMTATGQPVAVSKVPQAVVVGVGAAVAVAGAVVLGVQYSQGDVLEKFIGGFTIDQAIERRDGIYRLRTVGTGLLVGGLVVAAGGALWFALTGSTRPAPVALVPVQGGAVATWSVQW